MADFRVYIGTLYRHWKSGITGGILAVLLTIFQLPRYAVVAALLGYVVVAGYFAWREEHRKYLSLTGKAPLEAIDDLISDFGKLGDQYSSYEPGDSKPLDNLITRAIDELRHHAPDSILRFKNAATNPNALRQAMFPQLGRTTAEFAEWTMDKARVECWNKSSSCILVLKGIRDDSVRKSYR